ncbi:hypothetical protein [Sutcliffiella horikoshii]
MNQTEMLTEIQQLEKEILEKKKQLAEMKRNIEKEKSIIMSSRLFKMAR